jgi:hypothetical protein
MITHKQKLSGGQVRFSLLILLTLSLAGCIGPEGPMGPAGYDGRDGTDGLDGINYTSSAIYDVQPNDWTGNADGYNKYLDVPEITDDIYYNGAVLVYRLIEIQPKSFNLLPYTYMDNALTIYMDFDAYVGGINLIYKEIYNGVNDTPAPAQTMSFKVVIIEGIPLATVKTMVNINDFNAVSRMFKVEDVPIRIQ